jgi:hypothetical protein
VLLRDGRRVAIWLANFGPEGRSDDGETAIDGEDVGGDLAAVRAGEEFDGAGHERLGDASAMPREPSVTMAVLVKGAPGYE